MELGKSQDKISEYEQKKRFKNRKQNLSREQMKIRTAFAFIKGKLKNNYSNSYTLIQVLLKPCSGTVPGK